MHPTLLHFGPIAVPTYGLVVVMALLAGMALLRRTSTWCGVSPERMLDAGLFGVVAAFVASRLLLVLWAPRSFVAAPVLLLMQPSLTGAGLLLAVLVTAVFVVRQRVPLLLAADASAAPVALVWSLLGLGDLLSGLDPGMPVARWGLRTALAGYREVPVALYVAVAALALTAVLLWRTRVRHRAGSVAAAGLMAGGVIQFVLSFWRLPYLWEPGSAWTMLDPVQWRALGVVVGGGLLALGVERRFGRGGLALPLHGDALGTTAVSAAGDGR